MIKYIFLIVIPFSFNVAFGQINIVDYNKAVEQINIAKGLMDDNNYASAIPFLERAITYDSTIRAAYMLIYEAGYSSGNINISIYYLEEAKIIFQGDDEVLYYLGKSYQKKKNYMAALLEFNEAIKFSKVNGDDLPILYDYYASRGVCYLKKGNYQLALNDFNSALKENEFEGSIFVNRGYALYKLNRVQEGCDSWQEAFDLGHTYVNQYLEKYCK